VALAGPLAPDFSESMPPTSCYLQPSQFIAFVVFEEEMKATKESATLRARELVQLSRSTCERARELIYQLKLLQQQIQSVKGKLSAQAEGQSSALIRSQKNQSWLS
jgi:hypothetical protein